MHDDTASTSPRALQAYPKTLSRDHLDFYHGLLDFRFGFASPTLSASPDQSYYEIALTNRQVMSIFVVFHFNLDRRARQLP